MSEGFTIDKVAWHTAIEGNTESRESVIARFSIFSAFLYKNGLLVRNINRPLVDIDDDFEINSDDLTDEGMKVVKRAYDKWLGKIDKGMDPANVSILQKALDDVRSQS